MYLVYLVYYFLKTFLDLGEGVEDLIENQRFS